MTKNLRDITLLLALVAIPFLGLARSPEQSSARNAQPAISGARGNSSVFVPY